MPFSFFYILLQMYFLLYFSAEKKYAVVDDTAIVEDIGEDQVKVVWDTSAGTEIVDAIIAAKCKSCRL